MKVDKETIVNFIQVDMALHPTIETMKKLTQSERKALNVLLGVIERGERNSKLEVDFVPYVHMMDKLEHPERFKVQEPRWKVVKAIQRIAKKILNILGLRISSDKLLEKFEQVQKVVKQRQILEKRKKKTSLSKANL